MNRRIQIFLIVLQVSMVLVVMIESAAIESLSNSKSSATTASDAIESMFNRIWDGIVDPPEEFGLDLDLNPQLLSPDCVSKESFEPLLELSQDLLPDMFYKSDTLVNLEETNSDLLKTFVSGLAKILSVDSLRSKFVSARDRFQSFVKSVFKGETANSLQTIRAKLDHISESIHDVIVRSGGAGSNQKCDEVQNCLKQVAAEFRQWESSLHTKVQNCTAGLKELVAERKTNIQELEQSLQESNQNFENCQQRTGVAKAACINLFKIKSVIRSIWTFVFKGAQNQNKILTKIAEQTKACIGTQIESNSNKDSQEKLSNGYKKCIEL